MKRYITAGLVAATLGASLVAASPAYAATIVVTECTFSLDVTFSNPLTLSGGSGTLTATYGESCNDIYDDGSIVGRVGGPYTVSADYTGSCLLATFSGPIVGTIVGGTVLAGVDVGQTSLFSLGAWVMTPDQICFESSAHGTLGATSAVGVSLFPN